MIMLIYLGMIVSMIGVSGLDIKPLTDGIIVSRGSDIRIIEGEWTLLLTIHEDDVAHGLATHAELVMRARTLWGIIRIQNNSVFFTEDRRALMRAKMGLVIGANQTLSYQATSDRERRGVLDFIGTGLNWAFGTATQSQVDALQKAVDAASASQHAIVHNIKELITVVNQTQLEGVDTRRKLSALSTSYDRFVHRENDRWDRFDHNTKLLMMEEYINSLLWLDAAVWKGINRIRALHGSLRAGDFTEELCPASLLMEISRLAAGHGLRALPLNWYYENVHVIPLMIKDGLMTFRVTLPYADDNTYQRYKIRTYAVPIDTAGSRARAAVQPDIALDTANGLWFVPTLCQGHRPQLCRAGPRWRDAYPCERGLITGHAPDRKLCKIVLTNTTATTAAEIREGIFILQTRGEVVRLTCTGQTQRQTTLARGTYKVNITEGCVLAGGRWELHGMVRKYLSAQALLRGIEIPPLDLKEIVRQHINNSRQYQVHLDLKTQYEQYKPNYVKMSDDTDGYPEVLIAHHLSWTAIGLLIIVLCISVYVAIWVYRRRVKIRVFFADALFAKRGAKTGVEGVKYDVKTPDKVQIVPKTESTDTAIV